MPVQTPIKPGELYTARDVAELVGVSKQAVQNSAWLRPHRRYLSDPRNGKPGKGLHFTGRIVMAWMAWREANNYE